MAPQKMLYIKDEDVGLISKAQECSKENFSNTVIKALKFYLDSQEDADFDLQKLIIGFDPIVFERENIPSLLNISPEINSLEETDPVWGSVYNFILDYLQVSFFQTPITFFGKELISKDQNYASVSNLREIKISKEIVSKAFDKDFATPCPYDLISIKALEDDEESSEASDSMWFSDITVCFKAFLTRGGKFLIWASTESEGLSYSDLGLNSIVPSVADYAVFDELSDDLKTIKTENYGIEFELPPCFVKDIKQALRTQKSVKHLNL